MKSLLTKRKKDREDSKMSNSIMSEEDVTEIKKVKEKLRLENIKHNLERQRRQEEYKKYKVLIKHAKALTNRLRHKVNNEIQSQVNNYLTNLELLEAQTSQAKMDAVVKKSKLNSKSMQQLITKSDVKDQVIKKRRDEGEGEDEFE